MKSSPNTCLLIDTKNSESGLLRGMSEGGLTRFLKVESLQESLYVLPLLCDTAIQHILDCARDLTKLQVNVRLRHRDKILVLSPRLCTRI